MAYPYRVALTEAERAKLPGLVGSGTAPARLLTRARILLKADHGEGGPGWSDAAVAGALNVSPSKVLRVRRQFVAEGLGPTLARKRPDRVYERRLDGRQEAYLVALACAAPPAGQPAGRCACWPGSWSGRRSWRRSPTIPCAARSKKRAQAVADGAVVPRPDVGPRLRLADGGRPRRLRAPLRPGAPRGLPGRDQPPAARRRPPPCRRRRGRPARRDPEYVRGGVANLFLVTEPLRRWRAILGGDECTRLDWARCVRELVDVHYPDAERVVLVMDQLNTHSPASPYAAFPPAEAWRLAERLEIHHTPKHGSWLNMAELELAVCERQCLRRQFGECAALEREAAAWAARRDAARADVDWRFTIADARAKLKRLYPAFHE